MLTSGSSAEYSFYSKCAEAEFIKSLTPRIIGGVSNDHCFVTCRFLGREAVATIAIETRGLYCDVVHRRRMNLAVYAAAFLMTSGPRGA
jgi:hypothetical protein